MALSCSRPALERRVFVWIVAGLAFAALPHSPRAIAFDDPPRPELAVPATEDFEFGAAHDPDRWTRASWAELVPREPGKAPRTRVKMLHSPTGLYVLFDADDQKLTATMREDYAQLWREDVLEVFLWPDERHPVYFEYEISPLGFELPLLVPNLDGQFVGWIPWEYRGARKVRKAVRVRGGEGVSGASIEGWGAELFIPYALLAPMHNMPPKPGSKWRANFYRMDYDVSPSRSWDWARVGGTFHEFKKFGTIRFE